MPRTKEKKAEAPREKMISIFDPGVQAYREVPISVAKQFVKASKEVEKQLAEIEE